jgi:hypothetical protein
VVRRVTNADANKRVATHDAAACATTSANVASPRKINGSSLAAGGEARGRGTAAVLHPKPFFSAVSKSAQAIKKPRENKLIRLLLCPDDPVPTGAGDSDPGCERSAGGAQ